MVATLVHDRKISKEADKKIDLANKQRRMVEAKNTELEAKVDRLQAELDYYKALLGDKNE
jgi:outer membrane protein TolC